MSATADFQIEQPTRKSAGSITALNWALVYFSYGLFLYWAYVEIIQPDFYWELKISQNAVNPFFGALLAAFASLFVPRKFAKPSDVVLMFAFAVHVVPLLMIAPHYDTPLAFSLVTVSSYILICVLAGARPLQLPSVRGGVPIFIAFATVCLAATIADGVQSGTLSLSNLSLRGIYDARRVSSDLVRGGLAEYMTGWTANVLIMALLVITMLRKNYALALPLLAVQLSLFLITSEKLTLFIPAFGAIAYLAFEKKLSPAHLMAGLVALVTAGAFAVLQYNFQLLNFLLVRRIIFTPPSLDALYTQVFDVYGFQYWAQFLSRFTGDAGGPPPAVVVGATLSNSLGDLQNAGTGYLGSGYMQAGYAGMLFYAVLLGLMLYLANSLAFNRVRTSVATVIIFYPFWSALNDSDLPTAFLTQGIFIALFALALLGENAKPAAPRTP